MIHYVLIYYYHFHIIRTFFSGRRRITNHWSYLSLGKGEQSWLSRGFNKGCAIGYIASLVHGNHHSCIDQHSFQQKFKILVYHTKWIEMINPGSSIQEEKASGVAWIPGNRLRRRFVPYSAVLSQKLSAKGWAGSTAISHGVLANLWLPSSLQLPSREGRKLIYVSLFSNEVLIPLSESGQVSSETI